MIVIAHRGANRKALENSFEAFNLAIKDGADRLELDIHLSKDKQLFVMHDEDLTRTAGAQHSKICELNGRDIQNKNSLIMNQSHYCEMFSKDTLSNYRLMSRSKAATRRSPKKPLS